MTEALLISSVLLWVVVAFNLLLTLALVRRLNATPRQDSKGAGEVKPGLKPGEQAPDFTAETLQGEQVTLATYAGKGAAFIFFSTDCNPCKEALPGLEALRPAAQRAGVELVLVSNQDATKTRPFVEEMHVRLPVLIAPHPANPFMKDYNFNATPSYCLVDASGRVQSANHLSLQWGEWKELSEQWQGDRRGSVSVAVSEGG